MERELTIFIPFAIAFFILLVIADYAFSNTFDFANNALQAVFTLAIIRFLMWVFKSIELPPLSLRLEVGDSK